MLFHIWAKLGGDIGYLVPFSQRTAGEDGRLRALEITSKGDIRSFVEVQAPELPLPGRCA